MKLYLLERNGKTGWDECDSILVRAKDVKQARQLATEHDGGNTEIWMSPLKSKCEEVTGTGKAETVISSFYAE